MFGNLDLTHQLAIISEKPKYCIYHVNTHESLFLVEEDSSVRDPDLLWTNGKVNYIFVDTYERPDQKLTFTQETCLFQLEGNILALGSRAIHISSDIQGVS